MGVSAGVSLVWLGAQPEGPAQDPALPPLGPLAAPRRPGQREELTCQVSLFGARAHLTAPVIGKLAGLIWMHVIQLFSSRWEWHLPPGLPDKAPARRGHLQAAVRNCVQPAAISRLSGARAS